MANYTTEFTFGPWVVALMSDPPQMTIRTIIPAVLASAALSAPTLTRTSGVSTYPPTADITRPGDWQDGNTLLVQRSQDVTFVTGVSESTSTLSGATTSINASLSSISSGVWYIRAAAYSGTRPGSLNFSNIIGVGDTTAPTITSSSTITLSSGTPANLSLTANEFVTWSITGGANSDQFTLSGSILTCLAQTVGGSYSVQVTATDPCGNSTNQTITASLTFVEFSSASADKNSFITLSGTPKLTATGTAGVGSAMLVRLNTTSTGKKVWQITPNYVAGDTVYFGLENGANNFSGFGTQIGYTNSNGISLGFGDWGWEIYYSSLMQQSNYASPHVAGDSYMLEYDTSTGSFSYFRVRSGVKTQLGTTVTGLTTIPAIDRGFTGMKNDSSVVASLNSFAATPTAGYSNYA